MIEILSNRPSHMVGPVQFWQCVAHCRACDEGIVTMGAGAGVAAYYAERHVCGGVTCESCGREAPADEEGAPALGMTDFWFCPPGYGCSSVDEHGRDRLARGRELLGTHAEGRRS